MQKTKSFLKKHGLITAFCVIALSYGAILNSYINSEGDKMAFVILTQTTPPYYQYPSLSNSGFYLVTNVNRGNYITAITAVTAKMETIKADTKLLSSDYYASSCSTQTTPTALCVSKLKAISNSLYTYATYATTYNRLVYESTHGKITNENIDWAGIASASIVNSTQSTIAMFTIKKVTINIDGFLSKISTYTQGQITSAVAQGSFKYISPLDSEVLTNMANLLKIEGQAFNKPSTQIASSYTAPTYQAPYRFVFSPNPLGSIEFKIPNRNTLILAGIAGATETYGQVNGSLAEINATLSNLNTIETSVGSDVLVYAEVKAIIASNNITTNCSTEVDEVSKITQEQVSADDNGNVSSGPGSSKCPDIIDAPFTCTVNGITTTYYKTSTSSVATAEKKLVEFANNKPSGPITAKGETGMIIIEYKNGKVDTYVINGCVGEANGINDAVSDILSKISDKNIIKAIYHEHTHDIITTSKVAFKCLDKNGKEVPSNLVSPTTPSFGDFNNAKGEKAKYSKYNFEHIFRVFAPNGSGVEYSQPNEGIGGLLPYDVVRCVLSGVRKNMKDNGRDPKKDKSLTEDFIAGYKSYYSQLINRHGAELKTGMAGDQDWTPVVPGPIQPISTP